MTAPLTPVDCDLRDFPFMPLDVVALTSLLRSDSLSPVTEKNVTGIGVLSTAVKAAIEVMSGFFTLGVPLWAAGREGSQDPPVAVPVRQLPSRSSSPIGVGLGGSKPHTVRTP